MGNLPTRLLREGGEQRALFAVGPSGPSWRRRGRRIRRRAGAYPTGFEGKRRDHSYVQKPHHVDPPYSARPFISLHFGAIISTPFYVDVLAPVEFAGNRAVPDEYRAVIRRVFVYGTYSATLGLDPVANGRWQLTRNGIATDGLLELRPSTSVGSPAPYPESGAVENLSPLEAPILGHPGDVFAIQGKTVGGPVFLSAVVSGWIYPQQMAGDTIRESWVDKPE
jgi:hypothetical protein